MQPIDEYYRGVEAFDQVEGTVMSLLDHPEAQALLNDATVSADDVRGCRERLTRFLARYLPLFYRQEQRSHAGIFVRGLLSDLERKSAGRFRFHVHELQAAEIVLRTVVIDHGPGQGRRLQIIREVA